MFSIGVSFLGEKADYCVFFACFNGVKIGGPHPGYDGLLRALDDIRRYKIRFQQEKGAANERAEIDQAQINAMKKRLLDAIFEQMWIISTLADRNSEVVLFAHQNNEGIGYIYNKTTYRILFGAERDTIDELLIEQNASSREP
ncbi:hypothetical protein V5F38_19440 [Xanthobacter sp. V0B-10]|uniref:hypothetical protein n=1 Tax=Xanthobacter albus TaxID=3119929 RepID=UPI00372B84E4